MRLLPYVASMLLFLMVELEMLALPLETVMAS
jgi:hypothetical protein